MKECNEQLAEKIQAIIMCSTNEGKVPGTEKVITVPIYKGGNREDSSNYRPVTPMSIAAKVSERIIKVRWMKYLVNNKILTDKSQI